MLGPEFREEIPSERWLLIKELLQTGASTKLPFFFFCCQLLKSYSNFKAKEIICDIVNNKGNAGFLAAHDTNYLPSFISGLERGFTPRLSMWE